MNRPPSRHAAAEATGHPAESSEGFDWWTGTAPAPRDPAPRPLRPARVVPAPTIPASTIPASTIPAQAAGRAPAGPASAASTSASPAPAASALTAAALTATSPIAVSPAAVSPTAASPAPAAPGPHPPAPPPRPPSAAVYRAVQQSDEFQSIRRAHRTFVFPMTALFLGWYLLYLVTATTAPALMRRHLAGPLNLAWLLGLLQFSSTFLITWLYGRNARAKRDRAALGLRWDTQDRLR